MTISRREFSLLSWVSSYDLYWENKIDKRTRAINRELYILGLERLRVRDFLNCEGWFPYDRRRSWIADRRKLCDRLRSYGNTLLRSSAILRSYGNQSFEMYLIIFLILTDDSTLLSHKARMFVYSNAHLL